MDTVSYQCPRCGAPLGWDAGEHKWKCEFCLSEFGEKELDGNSVDTAPQEEQTAAPEVDPDKVYVNFCPQCGAELVADETTAATFCVFCGNTAIIKRQLEGKFAPAKIIPFQVDKKTSEDAFRKLCRRKPLAPRRFLQQQHIEKITGVYLPFWLFTCDLDGHIAGTAERINTWSDSKYNYTQTRFYRVIRSARMNFLGIPADGAKKMDNALMDSIEPFDYSQMVDFSLPYLSGFLAERYDEDQDTVFPRAEARMETSAEELLRSSIQGYSTYQITGRRYHLRSRRSEYVLLPVWMVNSRYKGRDYLFAMNGQTGKMIGNLPISTGRTLAAFGICFAAVLLLLLLGGMLF